jgi:hypothetical protein
VPSACQRPEAPWAVTLTALRGKEKDAMESRFERLLADQDEVDALIAWGLAEYPMFKEQIMRRLRMGGRAERWTLTTLFMCQRPEDFKVDWREDFGIEVVVDPFDPWMTRFGRVEAMKH